MDKKSILLMLDSDALSSVFDRVVAIDGGAEVVLAHADVHLNQVQGLVHGCIFTRSPKDLHQTAIFIGGSNVEIAETLFAEVKKTFLPNYGLTVSIMMDANGCNTTAASAVRLAGAHMALKGTQALVLGGTGPVGERVGLLLAYEGVSVRLASRTLDRARLATSRITAQLSGLPGPSPVAVASPLEVSEAAKGCSLVISCGAAGVPFVSLNTLNVIPGLRLVMDLNGVPPLGILGIDPSDKARERDGVVCFGSIGVGGLKIKLHRACIAKLYESNKENLEIEQIYALSKVITH